MSTRNVADFCLSRHQTMVWFNCTLTLRFPLHDGAFRLGDIGLSHEMSQRWLIAEFDIAFAFGDQVEDHHAQGLRQSVHWCAPVLAGSLIVSASPRGAKPPDDRAGRR